MKSSDSNNRQMTLGTLAALLAITLCADQINGWSLYAFPLGTLLTALGIPIMLVILICRFVSSVDTLPGTDDAE